MEGRRLIAVRGDVLGAVLVEEVFAAVRRRLHPQAGPGALERALSAVTGAEAAHAEPAARHRLAARLARAGWLTREVERERFEPARAVPAWLAERMAERSPCPSLDRAQAAAAVAGELARDEPVGRPAPDDERAASWRVPGPGGHVRHMLAERWIAHERVDRASELERAFLYGFFLRCCEEALGDYS